MLAVRPLGPQYSLLLTLNLALVGDRSLCIEALYQNLTFDIANLYIEKRMNFYNITIKKKKIIG